MVVSGWRSPWLLKADSSLKDLVLVPDQNWVTVAWNGNMDQKWLRLFPSPDGELTNNFSVEPSIKFMGRSTSYSPAVMQRSFVVTIDDGNASLYNAVRWIANRSNSTGLTQLVPVTALDYAFPEEADVLTGIQNGTHAYTVRYGLIKGLQPSGALIRGSAPSENYYQGGFAFTFEETVRRIVL